MTLRRTPLASALAVAAAATVLAVSGTAAYAQDTDTSPRALVCAATTTADVNAVLAGAGDSGLPDDLLPILDLTDLTDTGLALDPTVSLVEVKTALLCDEVAPDPTTDPDPTTEPTPTTDPTPTTTTTAAPTTGPTVASVLAAIAALNCGPDEAEQRGRINDDTFALISAGTSSADIGRISDALRARNTDLGYCLNGAPTTTPGADTIPGGGFTQVDEVPSLPAQTGGGPA